MREIFKKFKRLGACEVLMICGIVDLGSNTIRLSIYKYENKNMKLLLSKKSIAGLLGYVEDGRLSQKASPRCALS